MISCCSASSGLPSGPPIALAILPAMALADDSDLQASTIERRCSEAYRGRCPPDRSRSEGTPSPSERAERRSKRFCAYFFEAFVKKVSRRKGETLSGRYRSSGYSPQSRQRY